METVKSVFLYFINKAPGEFSYYIPLSVLCGILIVGGIIFSLIYNKKKKTDFAFKRLFKSVSKRMIIFAILFIILMLIRYQHIAYLSMRLWMYLLSAVFLYFVYRYARIAIKDYPREKNNVHTNLSPKKDNKYLPNKK